MQQAAEKCDFCSVSVQTNHTHFMNAGNRKLLCACPACVVLLGEQAESKYKKVPDSIRFLPAFHLTDEQWDRLSIPIQIAFFFYNSTDRKITSYYPSPSGPIESLLPLDCWNEVTANNPLLNEMQPDVEALLVNRMNATRDYYLVPIDECYALVGIMRLHWKGFSGGTGVWNRINRFFDELRKKS